MIWGFGMKNTIKKRNTDSSIQRNTTRQMTIEAFFPLTMRAPILSVANLHTASTMASTVLLDANKRRLKRKLPMVASFSIAIRISSEILSPRQLKQRLILPERPGGHIHIHHAGCNIEDRTLPIPNTIDQKLCLNQLNIKSTEIPND